MIRRLLSWITLVPGRKVVLLDAYSRLWRGRVRCVRITWVGLTLDKTFGWTLKDAITPAIHGGIAVRSRSDEGRTWARGWTGPAVDALRAAHALR